jgi:hypothetical protein
MEVADSTQADSLEVLVIGQAFEGVPWGYVITTQSRGLCSDYVLASQRHGEQCEL